MSCIHEIVNENITNCAVDLMKKVGEGNINVPGFLHLILKQVSIMIYEAAPSAQQAEELINDAVNVAKEIWLETNQCDEE